MRPPILVLRVSRRAVAAAVLTDERLAFLDGRHLRSRREAAVAGIRRYTQLLLELTTPKSVVIDAPRYEGSQTEALLVALAAMLHERNLAAHHLAMSDVLSAFGMPGLASRLELRALAEPLFSELATIKGKVKPYVIDAAASALYTESGAALGRFPPP